MARCKAAAKATSHGWGVSAPGKGAAGVWATAAFAACLLVGVRGQSVTASPAPPHFLRDIAPTLDKQGCSTAACHGKFGGRGGFQVSLLTLSPQDDYDPIVRGGRGRRVNLVEPEKSLLLLKATGQIGHAGGTRFAVGSREYRLIRDWIAAGAPYDPENEPRLSQLIVTPAETVLPSVGAREKLRVLARFTDGLTEDVTPYANFDSSDPAVLSVDSSGVVTGKRWGGATVIVRYLGTVQSASLVLPRADKTPSPKVAGSNFIDDFVLANLRKMKVPPSRLASDREFVRRVTLDVCGRLPSPADADTFVADPDPRKRARLIDTLLDSPEYADMRTLRLCDMLRVNPRLLGNNNGGDREAALLTDWVHDAVARNVPYDQFVRDLLTARGSSFQDGAAAFYLVSQTPQDRMETIGQAFLGQRMACARCHKHPFDKWTTDDYWNFAAFMGKVGVRNGTLPGENEVFYNPGGRVVNDSVTGTHRGKVAPPTFLGDTVPASLAKDTTGAAATIRPASAAAPRRTALGDGEMAANGTRTSAGVSEGIDLLRGGGANDIPRGDLLLRLANWATAPENPYFARATVNRLWSHYLGRGIVHPVDDMRVTTPPSVPGLLDALAKDFVAHNYDVKHEIRMILNSRTYQTASDATPANALDNQFFSHFYPRPMPGPVFLDILDQATGATERFGDFPADTRAVQLTLPVNSYTLDTFGRAHREFLAELEPKVEPTLVQTLHILNSPIIDGKIRTGSGTVAGLVRRKTPDDETVTTLYERTLSRPPTPKERATALKYLQAAPVRAEAVQDLMWALISSREFYFVS